MLDPWETEPNHLEFKANGLPCIIHRVDHGALCGYVGVPPGHPLYGKDYDSTGEIEVHGGITYADSCQGSICHKVSPGEPDDIWWFGFDCVHAGDYAPGFPGPDGRRFPIGQPENYKTIEYVYAECESLANQLNALSFKAQLGGL